MCSEQWARTPFLFFGLLIIALKMIMSLYTLPKYIIPIFPSPFVDNLVTPLWRYEIADFVEPKVSASADPSNGSWEISVTYNSLIYSKYSYNCNFWYKSTDDGNSGAQPNLSSTDHSYDGSDFMVPCSTAQVGDPAKTAKTIVDLDLTDDDDFKPEKSARSSTSPVRNLYSNPFRPLIPGQL